MRLEPCVWLGFPKGRGSLCLSGSVSCTWSFCMDQLSWCLEIGDAQPWVDSDGRNESDLMLGDAPKQREVLGGDE